MKKFWILFWIVCLGLVITACGSEPEEVLPTDTIAPASSPVPPTATVTPLPTAKVPPEPTTVDLVPVTRTIGSESVTHLTSTSIVNDIAFSQDGAMWVATNGGVVRWDLSDGTHKKFTADDGLVDNSITSLAVAGDGSVWFESYNGIASFDGTTWINETEQGSLLIGSSTEGNIWVLLQGSLLYFDGSEWKAGDSGEESPPYYLFDSITINVDGSVWAHTFDELWYFDGQTWIQQSTEDGYNGQRVHTIEMAPDGMVWVIADEGLFVFDGLDWTERSLPVSDEDGFYFDLLVMEDGSQWVSYISYENPDNSGLYTFEGENWEKYAMPDDLQDLLATSMQAGPDGAIVFGTIAGVFRLQDGSWQEFLIKDEPIGNQINAIHKDKEEMLWFATENGTSRFDGSNWLNFKPSLSYGSIFPYLQGFAETPDGELVSVGGKGIFILRDEQWELFIESPEWDIDPSLPSAVFDSLYIRGFAVSNDGEIWVSGNFFVDPYPGLGVFRYDGETWHHYTFSEVLGELVFLDPELIETGVLPSDDINAIAQGPDGAIWFGGYDGGVARFDSETWTIFSSQDYFPGETISQIVTGPDGSLWFATQNGFTHFDGGDWTVYDLGEDPANRGTSIITVDPQGVVWYVSGLSGFASFDGETFTVYTFEDNLYENLWGWLLEVDQQGRFWIGSGYGGIYTLQIPD